MKFSIATAITLLSAAAFAAPAPRTDDTTYQIKDFTTRRYDGKTINTLSFRILATNGGTLDFECIPYDPVTNSATQNFESGHVYFCGENSLFSFSYVPKHDLQTNELFLWQDVSENETLGGSAFTDDPICRAGGSSVDDLICEVPEDVHFAVSMEKLGG